MKISRFQKSYRVRGPKCAPEMLTSAMALVSISENASLTELSSYPLGRLRGWGSAQSRTSYKRDLASLDKSDVTIKSPRLHLDQLQPTRRPPATNVIEDSWGYYVEN
jgi:hypothetical protein